LGEVRTKLASVSLLGKLELREGVVSTHIIKAPEPRLRRVLKWTATSVTALAAVLAWLFGPKVTGLLQPDPQQVVYSAAVSDYAVPMAVNPAQTGQLDAPGVAKPLRVFSVLPGSSANHGRAAMGATEASSRTYLTGARLENGAMLTEVYSDRVTVVSGLHSYTLYLSGRGRSDQFESHDALTVGAFPAPEPQLSQKPVRATDAIRLVPRYSGVAITGFTAYPGIRSAEFARWGLKSGDVVTNLGGVPLLSTDQVEALLAQLVEGATLTAQLERGEEHLNVTLDGRGLQAATMVPIPPPSP
jgi:hypothetical protein